MRSPLSQACNRLRRGWQLRGALCPEFQLAATGRRSNAVAIVRKLALRLFCAKPYVVLVCSFVRGALLRASTNKALESTGTTSLPGNMPPLPHFPIVPWLVDDSRDNIRA